MFSFEEKRDEAKRAVTELRRRMTMRLYRKRTNNDAAARRVAVAEEIVADYQRAIDRRRLPAAANTMEPEHPQSDGAQYLLNLTKGEAQ